VSAIVIAAQPKFGCIHVATDAAVYAQDQTTIAFISKTLALPRFPCAITVLGSYGALPWMQLELSRQFSDFDDLVETAPGKLPKIVKSCGIEKGSDVIIAGISKERGVPEAYTFRLNDEIPLGNTREEVAANPHYPKFAGELVKIDEPLVSPIPTDQVIAADFQGFDLDGPPESVIWTMRQVLEMQRHMTLPAAWPISIGGYGQVTTISADGITQRVLQVWAEDENKIGGRLNPAPIDWSEWHRRNPKPGSVERKPALRVVR
jgi:hypothetical protein